MSLAFGPSKSINMSSEAERGEFQVELVPRYEVEGRLPGLVVTRIEGVVKRWRVRTW